MTLDLNRNLIFFLFCQEDKEFVEEEEDEIYADIKDQCVYELHKKFALINLAAQVGIQPLATAV